MCDDKGADLLRLMSAEIVNDDVHFASPRLRFDDRREEGDKLIARIARHMVAQTHLRCGGGRRPSGDPGTRLFDALQGASPWHD